VIFRFGDPALLVTAAIAAFVAPASWLVVVGIGAIRRQLRHKLGRVHLALASFTGGLSEGTLLLFAEDLPLGGVLLVAYVVILRGLWQRRRRVEAGWLLLGGGIPSAILAVIAVAYPGTVLAVDVLMAVHLGGGVAAALAGIALIMRGDPPPLPPSIDAPAGQPGSRSVGSFAAAIREPNLIGPFGIPEIALLVTYVATWLIVPVVLPADTPAIVRIALVTVVGSVLGTEIYLRAMTTRSRRAFEAFSWLGEWELARAREAIGGNLPLSSDDAAQWLEVHPEQPLLRPNELAVRIEILLFANRIDDARRALDRLPDDSPWARFEAAALRDLVDWRAGGDGDLRGMQEAAAEIRPRDGDDRLRAGVTIAVAKVRRLMAEGRATPDEAVKPFLDVRDLLGRRADGQIGRALRPRLLPVLIIAGVVLGIVGELLSLPF
jgi:hypothetical protein